MERGFDLRDEAEKESRYDLSPEEMARRTRDLLREREPASGDKFVCYMLDERHEQNSYYTDIARSMERAVFERRFPENDVEGMQHEYNPYEEQSAFFLSIDTETGRPAGTIRIIRNGERGFKTLEDLAAFKDDPEYPDRVFERYGIADKDTCWDVATAAVPDEYGGGEVSSQIYRGMWVASQLEQIRHFFSVIDKRPFELMEFLGFPFKSLPEVSWMPYAGSKSSLPVHGDAPAFEESVRQKFESITDEDTKEYARSFFRTLGYGDNDDALEFVHERRDDIHPDDLGYAA